MSKVENLGSIAAMREIKPHEKRAALTPENVAILCEAGFSVFLGDGFGDGFGVGNRVYENAGAKMLPNEVELLWGGPVGLIVGVKEPVGLQVDWLKNNRGMLGSKTLFTYLHLANPNERELAEALRQSDITAVAYETVSRQLEGGRVEHPLLKPMSVIAGTMSVDWGSYFLSTANGGRGSLLGKLSGLETTDPGKVVIIGGGAAGAAAASRALRLGAGVFVLESNPDRRRELEKTDALSGIHVVKSTSGTIAQHVTDADLVIAAVYKSGEAPPTLISLDLQREMKKGAVIMTIDCDQGPTVKGVRGTTHENPSYVTESGQVICAISNMPAAYAGTATEHLSNATLPFIQALAASGVQALIEDVVLRRGLNVYGGEVTNPGVAKAHGFNYVSPEKALGIIQ